MPIGTVLQVYFSGNSKYNQGVYRPIQLPATTITHSKLYSNPTIQDQQAKPTPGVKRKRFR